MTLMADRVGVPFFVNQPRSSRRTPSPSYGGKSYQDYSYQQLNGQNDTGSPVTFNRGSGQGPNGGIISMLVRCALVFAYSFSEDNAGSMQVIGQGQNSQIQIGCNGKNKKTQTLIVIDSYNPNSRRPVAALIYAANVPALSSV